MCVPIDPLTAIGFAFSALGSISQFAAGNNEADIGVRQANERNAAEQQAISNQQQEIEDLDAEEQTAIQREAAVLRGRVRVASGEAGLGGNSVLALLGDVDREAGLQTTNLDFTTKRRLRENIASRGRSNLATRQSIESTNLRRPSAIGAGLRIAGAGVDAFREGT